MSDTIPATPVEESETPDAPPTRTDAAPDASPPRRRTLPLCMHIVAPVRENAVWTLLAFLPGRKFLGLWATVTIIAAGCLAGHSGFQGHPRTESVIFAVVFFAWLYLAPLLNLAPQMGFHSHVRRNGLGEALLSAPIPPDAYVGAFLRYYLAVLVQGVAGFGAYWWLALVTDPESASRTLGDTDFVWFVAGVVALWSASYWVAICRGPFLWCVAAYIMLMVHEIFDPLGIDVRFFGSDGKLFWHTSVVIWFALALAGMVYCRLHYAERLRARLFP